MPLSIGDFAPTTAAPTTSTSSTGGSLSLNDFSPPTSVSTTKASLVPSTNASLSLNDFNPSAPVATVSSSAAAAGASFATSTPAVLGISPIPLSDPTAETNYLNTQAPILTQRGKDLQTQSNIIVTSKASLDKLGATYDSMESNLTTLKAGVDASAKNLQAYENYDMAPQAMVDAHNSKVAAYNDALGKFQGVASQYKQSVDAYNASVGDYSSKSDQYNSDVHNFNGRVPLPGPEYANEPETNPLKQFKGQTISEANPTDKVSTSVWSKIEQAIVPSFLQKELGISSGNTTADEVKTSGDLMTVKEAQDNPQSIDPMMYFQKGLSFGNNLNGNNVLYDKNFPDPTTTGQKFAYITGSILTMTLAQPLIESALSSIISKVPILSAAQKGLETISKTAPQFAKSALNWAKSVATATATGGIFGAITKNKDTLANNIVNTAGMFAGFQALAYPIKAFFMPIMKSVGQMDIQNPTVKNLLNDSSVTGVDKSQTLWFKNPNNDNQFLKVTANGIEFKSGTEGIVASGQKISDLPILTKIEVEAFQKNPSLYENLKTWVKGKIAPDVSKVDFGPESKVPDETTMQEHMEQAKNEVANPTSEAPTVPAALEHPFRAVKAEAVQSIPKEKGVVQQPRTVFTAASRYMKESVMPAIKDGRAVIIGGDDLKYHFGKDFSPEKHLIYSHAANQVLLEAAQTVKNPIVRMTAGGPGSTKSELVAKYLSKDFNGIIYDTNLHNYEGAKAQIKLLNDHGKTVEVYMPIRDVETARAFTLKRAEDGGHSVSLDTFARNHVKVPEVVRRLAEEGLIKLHVIDLRGKSAPGDFKDIEFDKNPIDTLSKMRDTEDTIKNRVKDITSKLTTDGNNARIQAGRLLARGADGGSTEGEATSTGESGRVLRGEEGEKLNTQGGFINPQAIVDSVKGVAKATNDYIIATNANIDNSQILNDTLYTATKNSEADTITNHKALVAILDEATPAETKNIDDYRDQKRAGLELPALTEREQSFNALIDALYKDQAEKIAFIKDSGTPFSHDDYDHRIVKDKGGALDKLVASKDKLIPKGMGTKKNVLKKSAPALKKQEMFNATNIATGKRMVIHVPSNKAANITAFHNKQLFSLGKINRQSLESLMKEEVRPIQNKIKTTQKLIDILKSIKTRDPVSENKLDNLRNRVEALKIFAKERENNALEGVHKSMTKDIERTNEKIDNLEIHLKALEKFGNIPRVAKAIEKLSNDIGSAYEYEANLSLSDVYENLTDFTNSKHAIDEKLNTQLEKTQIELKILSKVPKALSVVLTKNRIDNAKDKLRELTNEMADIENKYNPNQLDKRVFEDENGNRYEISQATKNEIEQHSNVQYFHNPFVAAFFSHEDVTQAFEAVKLMESLKNDPKFTDRTLKVGEGNPPDGWKMTNLPQFQGVYMEPHQANVLNAFGQELKNGDDPVKCLTAINQFVLNYMFLGPVRHLMNVGASAIINRGVQWINPMAYPRLARTTITAVKSIVTQDEDYIKLLRAGVPMQGVLKDQAEYRQAVLDSLGEPQDKVIKNIRQTANLIGKFTPFHWAHTLTWPGNNMILHQGIAEELDRKGLTIKSATVKQIQDASDKVTRIIPNYRLPVAVRRLPKYVVKNTLLFPAYRLNMIRTFFELGKTMITGNDTMGEVHFNENGKQSYFSKQEWKARGEAFSQIFVMFLLAALAEPFINKELQKWTENNNAYLSPPGQLSDIQNANKLISGDINIGQYIQTITDLAQGTKEILQQVTNLDFFTGKTIETQGTPTFSLQNLQERGAHAAGVVTPFDLTQKLADANTTLGQILENQIGVYTPKGNNLINILQGSNASVLSEITRLLQTAIPPSSTDITKRVDVQVFQSQVTPEKFTEAMNQYSGLFVSNIAKLMANQYMKPATATSVAKLQDYQGAPDAQKSAMIDSVKDATMKTIEKAYGYNQNATASSKAVFEGHTSLLGQPTLANLMIGNPDQNKGKTNPKGEIEYERLPLATTDAYRTQLYNSDSYWKDNGYNLSDLQLDDIVPYEAGGGGTKNNLMLITKLSDQLNQPFEDYLGARYKAGTISRSDAVKASYDYKILKSVSLTDIKNGKY